METENEQERIARKLFFAKVDKELLNFQCDDSLTDLENYARFIDFQSHVYGKACGVPKMENENKEPKSEMAQQLKALLDNMSQEEFDKDWAEIVAMGFGSNTMIAGINIKNMFNSHNPELVTTQKSSYNEFWETLHD
jgi:hypothetical protein